MSFRKRFKQWLYGSCPGFAGSFPYFGFQVYFPPGSKSFVAACQQGIFEAEIVRVLQMLTQPRTHVLDVGGNIGLMAIPVLHHCPTCKVVSFEPSPSSLPYLRRTVSESGCADRWFVVEKALSNHAGEFDFAVGHPQDALYEGFKSAGRIAGPRMVKVPVSTLDLEWKRLGCPQVSVIKIDAEGAEALVLDGGAEVLDTCRPHVIVEWYADYLQAFDTRPEELLRAAQRCGYGIYSIPSGVHICDARTLGVQMLNCSNFLLVP
jgi:FkbM family methyltransferase